MTNIFVLIQATYYKIPIINANNFNNKVNLANHRRKNSNKKLDKLSFLLSEIILKTQSEGKT
tara:strand:+ start:1066 stop:1251 length:186 start_codon:yes stop_codon:yes gene_type:complete